MLAIIIFYPMIGGLVVYALRRRLAAAWLADFVAVTECLAYAALFVRYAATAGSGAVLQMEIGGICGMGLHFTLDGFRLCFGLLAAFLWMMATIFSREYMKGHAHTGRYYLFLLLTLGMTMGVFLAADLFTMFIFFEGMSFASYAWVAQEETPEALRASETYLAISVIGGLVMLMGIFGLWRLLGTLTISEMAVAASAYAGKPVLYAMGACLLVGFGAKAGAFPLHIWLPKSHPVAPAPASALLSGMLTKAGVLGVLIISTEMFFADRNWGVLLLAMGACTMFLGALLAVFSVDLKRTLACSSMSQIGFILIGVGMQRMLGAENALAVHGTFLHMANHSMIKLVLFVAAGIIYMNVHALNLNEIRGFGRKKPVLMASFLVGALAIAGIPCFGGYISKTLLHESILEYGGGLAMRGLEWLFLFSGGLTVAYMTKLFVAIFVEKNADPFRQQTFDEKKSYMNIGTTIALAGSAAVLLVWGFFPHLLMDRAASLGQGLMGLTEFGERVSYFSWKNLSGALISIVIGAVVYLLIRIGLMRENVTENSQTVKIRHDANWWYSIVCGKQREYCNRWPAWLDLENLIYRPLLLKVLPTVCGFFCRILDSLVDWVVLLLRKTIYRDSPLPHEPVEGTVLTEVLGRILNVGKRIANATWRKTNPITVDYRHVMAIRHTVRRESNQLIGRSMSYGLLLAGIGLCLTLLYILWI